MSKTVIILVLTIALYGKTYACLNGDSKILKDGTFLYEDREGNVPYGHDFYTDGFKDVIKQLDSLYKATNDLDYFSDKGLLLILTGKYEEAIKLYLEIEKIQSNGYATASNVGTAYELTGQNENALKWIKRSVELDSNSHKNSEWIHVRILEAKIKGEQYYTTAFLLKTEFGDELLPKSTLNTKELHKLSDALYYQLNERISFVKPKEKIVAQLLFDLGNIAFLLRSFHDARADYQLAKDYGYSGILIESRLKEADKHIKSHYSSNNIYLIYGISGVIVLVIVAISIYRRKKKNNHQGR